MPEALVDVVAFQTERRDCRGAGRQRGGEGGGALVPDAFVDQIDTRAIRRDARRAEIAGREHVGSEASPSRTRPAREEEAPRGRGRRECARRHHPARRAGQSARANHGRTAAEDGGLLEMGDDTRPRRFL